MQNDYLLAIICLLNIFYHYSSAKSRVRLTTPERWELRQMQGGGAIRNVDLPDFDEELGILKNFDGLFLWFTFFIYYK